MKNKPIPDYTSFFSEKAVKLVEWSSVEKNRIKARKIYEVACKFECYYRKAQTGDTSPDVHVWSGGCYTHADSLLMICATERWRKSKHPSGLLKKGDRA